MFISPLPLPCLTFNYQLQLLQDDAPEGAVHLPGVNGPYPKTSSGARALKLNHLPYFIGADGMETVQLKNAAWEMIWRDGSKSGVLICGFECPQPVRGYEVHMRNVGWLDAQ